MSKTVIVKIDEELSNYIEGLQVEVAARENIVRSILTTPGCEVNKALFDEYEPNGALINLDSATLF